MVLFWENFGQQNFILKLTGFYTISNKLPNHRRRKCGRCSPNSLRPISYFGSIRELVVLDLKTKVFNRKENQLHYPMVKGLTMPKYCLQFFQKSPKCLIKFQPNLSAQGQKFQIFEKKLSLCPQSVVQPQTSHNLFGRSAQIG